MSESQLLRDQSSEEAAEDRRPSHQENGTNNANFRRVRPIAHGRANGVSELSETPDLDEEWDKASEMYGLTKPDLEERVLRGLLGSDSEFSVVFKPADDKTIGIKLVWPKALYENVSRFLAEHASANGQRAKTPADWISELLAISPSEGELESLTFDNIRRVGCVERDAGVPTVEFRPKIPRHVIDQLENAAAQRQKAGEKGVKRTSFITALVLSRVEIEMPQANPEP